MKNKDYIFSMGKIGGSIVIIGALFACVGPAPVLEYNLAQQALIRANRSGAQKYSSGRWHKANSFYKKAQKYYDNRDYDKAYEDFENARKMAEKAENVTRIKKYKSGDGP